MLLNADLELKAKLKQHLAQLPALFIVSQVELLSAGTGEFRSDVVPGLEVSVQRADGKKCDRCWNYSIARWREFALSHGVRALQRGYRRD